MDPHAMGMQGGMSMPMSMGMAMSSGASGGNPQGLGMNAMAMNPAQYGVAPQQQQQQMMMNMNAMNGMNPMAMNSVGMQMNPNAMNAASVSGGMQVGGGQSVAGADWRIQLTREHRANLIAKIYNQMVRVSADPVPGIKLWMNVSWYELTLYRESPTQEVYINKIFTRLKSLRAQQSDMNAAMAAQALPNQGMLSRLDFSYYNTLNQQNQRPAAPAVNGGQVGGYPGHPQQFGGPAPHPGVQQQQQPGQAMASGTTNGQAAQTVKPESDMPANVVAGYWRQHAALRAKHQDDVEKVHSAFKKYVDHMKGHDETEQKKKLRYLLSYVELCANILSEDKTTHAPRKIEELDKVFKYIVKIVNPYLKKLRTETDKRSTTPGASTGPSLAATSAAATSTGANASSTNTSSGFSSAMGQQQQGGAQTQQKPGQQQNAATSAAQNQQASAHQTAQQKQQQYMMQQRAQQMQQRMQVQRQQQMMQQQQHMMQQQKGPQTAQQQAQFANQQANQMKQQQQQQNSQAAGNQQTDQQKQQQLAQQASQSHQNAAQQQQRQQQQQQQQKPQQQQSANQQQQSQQQSGQAQGPPSRGESPSLSSGLGLGLDDSLYGGMGSDLLQMPTPSGSNSAYMDFPNALSPTNFSGMDLLDWEDGSAQGGSGQGSSNANTSGGDSSDLMTFVETL